MPRTLLFYNFTDSPVDAWFPVSSPASGLGYHFALVRGDWSYGVGARWTSFEHATMDHTAMIRLNQVRTADLEQSRKNLQAGNELHRIGDYFPIYKSSISSF
ncbi:hypothetical protein [Legionella sp. W05-934-2]|uniref:hypothetical protein n=1 Tax=Legionella sp. W05-934-2 TaxID=1198649 RepID=UPI0034636D76